jgi:hypothetical protein
MDVENTNQVVINFNTYVSLSELETQCEESNSFLSLCRFLKSKTYTVIPLYVFNNFWNLKDVIGIRNFAYMIQVTNLVENKEDG